MSGLPRIRLLAFFVIAASVVASFRAEATTPCEAIAPTTDNTKTCNCGGDTDLCPYDVGFANPPGDPCLGDRLSCDRVDTADTHDCDTVLDDHPIVFEQGQPAPRCDDIARSTTVPNILLIVTDDWGWQLYQYDELWKPNEIEGRSYSPYLQYYSPKACLHGPDDGLACGKDANCEGTENKCLPWEFACNSGARKDMICLDHADCTGAAGMEPCVKCDYGPDGSCGSQRYDAENQLELPPLVEPNPPLPRLNVIKTPNLDSLAAGGAFFPVSHLTASKCMPAIAGILTGRYGAHLTTDPSTNEATNATIPWLLGQYHKTHCTLSAGKTWAGNMDVDGKCVECETMCPNCCTGDPLTGNGGCCADCADPKVGFHYSLSESPEFGISFKNIGREKHTLEKAACMMREMNKKAVPFFTWFVPYVPHELPGAPDAFKDCYTQYAQSPPRMGTVNGDDESYMSDGRLAHHSWGDCMIGAMLDFLKTTPDVRFCPDKDPANCPQCAMPCMDNSECDNGMCVDGACAGSQPCLSDTTVVFYLSDNGSPRVFHGKGWFTDNGYRQPFVMSYGGLGTLDSAPAGMPDYIAPQVIGKMGHALDLMATILDYAGKGLPDDPSRGPDHKGRSLRRLAEDPTIPWREYLFGHKNVTNAGNQIKGSSPQYLRTQNLPVDETGAVDIGLRCDTNQNCCDLGGSCPHPDRPACINGVCSSTQCEQSGEVNTCFGPNPTNKPAVLGSLNPPCLNGVCVTGNECKLYHSPGNPGKCTPKLYNLTYDPTESVNLITKIDSNGEPEADVPEDPFQVCRDKDNLRLQGMHCALVRWCIDALKASNETIQAQDCCVTQCAGEGLCVQLDESVPEENCNDQGNDDGFLWIPGTSNEAGCWDCTSITTTPTTTTTTTTIPCEGSAGCTGQCSTPGECCSTTIDFSIPAFECVCVDEPVGCNSDLPKTQCDSGSCPPGEACGKFLGFGNCVCAPE